MTFYVFVMMLSGSCTLDSDITVYTCFSLLCFVLSGACFVIYMLEDIIYASVHKNLKKEYRSSFSVVALTTRYKKTYLEVYTFLKILSRSLIERRISTLAKYETIYKTKPLEL